MSSARSRFSKVYTAKMPVTAADLLYDRVLPFYGKRSISRVIDGRSGSGVVL